MVQKNVDLHIHTTFSDGVLEPYQVVKEAKKKGLVAIAITDHDTMQGVPPAMEAGKKYGVEIIPGIELSTTFGDTEIHLLGYFCNPESPLFKETLALIRTSRFERMKKMVVKLNEINIVVDLSEVLAKAGGNMPGRPHLATLICQKGYCSTPAEAFTKYIGNDCPAYVERYELNFREALDLVRGAGGIPVLAHPVLYKRDELIPEMVHMGLLGIEAFHPRCLIADRYRYIGIARKYGLLITGGSDFHGEGLGSSDFIGTVKIDYKYLARLKEAKNTFSN